ncbi:NfeD family protein [Anaerobranca gottschalkii]|uniref:Membrane protein implicated in regulation of membrane protease activity n=1 Tax=Anaerobranca gottschalkii DSM 13577 TaxID=1120990 RepID=A0A1I0BAR9_9FIRM|nr:NfeD family protein [Anaerobranca gottschalkii]SET03632.1 Membrane protein implicated in regulation of membrane protease activity [Anaerobranca gottschalkii DSM 13577]
MNWVFWLVAIFVFLIGELFTTSFFLIWFAMGALVGLIFSLFGAGDVIQLISFAVTSGILILNSHKIVNKYIYKNSKEIKTTVDALIGKTGIVLQKIDNSENKGLVRLGGEQWSATAIEDDLIIEEGTKVEVVRVEGVRLIVKPKEKTNI